MFSVNLVSLLLMGTYLVPISTSLGSICLSNGTIGVDLVKSFLRSISHANLGHLVFNLVSFRNISEALLLLLTESKYLLVLGTIWVFEVLSDYLLMQSGWKRCSIGFSGVIFGLLTYFLMHTSNSYQVVLRNVGLLILPGLFTPGISNVGHLIGALIGLVVSRMI